ncbi:MAG TPA: hypothetical protein DD640_07590 [Clostridiales bacterium]|nr:hypothetical protein [Clostridiales bacterium]
MGDPSYQHLAPAYDLLQQDLAPSAWADYIQKLEARFSLRCGAGDGQDGRTLLLDLGCGTGSISLEMLRRGYDIIGIDVAAGMLEQAKSKAARMRADDDASLPEPLFLQQDISQFELYGTVDLIVCLLDTINHLVRPDRAARLFRLCANYLNPGGLLVFDLASRRHLSRTLGNRQFFQIYENHTLIWHNRYRPASQISRSEMVLFTRRTDGCYERQDIAIAEKYYSPKQVRQWSRAAGLQLIDPASGSPEDSRTAIPPPAPAAERRFYIARKPQANEGLSYESE